MIWKSIGCSVTGTSHLETNTPCEDHSIILSFTKASGEEVLVAVASDGAGSAKYGQYAANYSVKYTFAEIVEHYSNNNILDEKHLYEICENIYEHFRQNAETSQLPLNEYSCTLLGAVLSSDGAVFFQIGDGAIIMNNGDNHYVPVWWPHNGEYQNTTCFLIDDPAFPMLKIQRIQHEIEEIALFTDGLQQLVLDYQTNDVYQPFFVNLFTHLRLAATQEHIDILNHKLLTYLNSDTINNKTFDDKTLLLSTKIVA